MNVNDPILAKMSVPADATVRQVLQAISAGELGMALVVDAASRRFQGVLTDGDIRRALLAGTTLDDRVSSVPHPESRTAPARTPVSDIMHLFSATIRAIPLLEDGRVVDVAVLDRRAHLPVAEPALLGNELAYVSECVTTGWISSAGHFVSRFEDMVAKHCNAEFAVSTCNGTSALHLALEALGVGPGDEVIVPSFTFIATANAVSYTGATPVFVDSTPDTWTLDPTRLAQSFTPRTRAVIPVHVYGQPADMDAILEITERHGVPVIEDAAEAMGARYRDRPVGGIGAMGVFSFYGNKIITTGEGGMVVTSNPEWAERMRMLRDHGMAPDRRYYHPVRGFNYRMTNLQAAVGVAQMEKLDALLAARDQIAAGYAQGLNGLSGITLPVHKPHTRPVCWLYSILVDESHFGMHRDALMARLKEAGIETRPLFVPQHQQPVYEAGLNLPVAEGLSARGLSLPSSPGLTEQECAHVVDVIRKNSDRHLA